MFGSAFEVLALALIIALVLAGASTPDPEVVWTGHAISVRGGLSTCSDLALDSSLSCAEDGEWVVNQDGEWCCFETHTYELGLRGDGVVIWRMLR